MQSGSFSRTIVYGAKLEAGKRSVAYQCWADSSKPNALMFVVPTTVQLTDDNFVNLESAATILNKMSEVFNRGNRSISTDWRSKGLSRIIDVGMYTVVYSNKPDVDDVQLALNQVADDRRPAINFEIIAGFARIGFPIVIACYPPVIEQKFHPLALWYDQSAYENHIVLPMLDGHGNWPEPDKLVERDHWVFIGSLDTQEESIMQGQGAWMDVSDYLEDCPDIAKIFPLYETETGSYTNFRGKHLTGWLSNGDALIDIQSLETTASEDYALDFAWTILSSP
jgi:hypothetical protein